MEEWKDVKGYEGVYMVSNEGRVMTTRRGGKGLSISANKRGMKSVTLCKDGFMRRVQLNRLVLETFVGACPEKKVSTHADGDLGNCRLDNLSWGDRPRRGKGKSSLTDDDIRAIRVAPEPQKEVGKKWGISQAAVSQIQNRVTHRHVE